MTPSANCIDVTINKILMTPRGEFHLLSLFRLQFPPEYSHPHVHQQQQHHQAHRHQHHHHLQVSSSSSSGYPSSQGSYLLQQQQQPPRRQGRQQQHHQQQHAIHARLSNRSSRSSDTSSAYSGSDTMQVGPLKKLVVRKAKCLQFSKHLKMC